MADPGLTKTLDIANDLRLESTHHVGRGTWERELLVPYMSLQLLLLTAADEIERLREVLESIAHPHQLYGFGNRRKDLADALIHIAIDGLASSVPEPNSGQSAGDSPDR
jgi:hypothetical protein